MDELITWLRGVLDEDERLAREATHYNMITIESRSRSEEDHARRHDPATVLADIAAKRAILDWCVEVIGDRDLTTIDQFGSLRDDPKALAITLAVETLRLLASAYADRPGYSDEWRP